ncbi:MAG: NADP-dependent malic enzyme [Flavobacteriales bacterium]|nr:NADP-dependent malic enzyme [Flavobacteriales bacterium]
MADKRRQIEALDYHSEGKPGKIEIKPTKPYSSQRDLALAYSPGVAEPCKKIAEEKELAYKYTAKGNLVAVISNGTAVLGLGDIGPEASKPVMEGKGLLFKIFADIDVFDIEVDNKDVDAFVNTVKAIAPTFGGINLEDIKAPECFEIEKRLKEELDIPVMHDDQHGTAIISAAALLNALELAEKKIEDIRIVVNGAGASAMACINLYVALGARKSNIIMLDSKGVIRSDRNDLNEYKQAFATNRDFNQLEDAIKDADVFLGLSRGNILSKKMVKSMAENPIVFALANPDPEIPYDEAMSVRKDIIMATGRSDHPNQVNNVLGFPFIFRGALDVRATTINEEMKLAAVKAIAKIAKEPVPEEVNEAYSSRNLSFGRDFLIPKPMDPRLLMAIAPAVAKAAIDSGVAQKPIEDWAKYKMELSTRLGLDIKLIKNMTERARRKLQRVVFAEADNYKVLRAAQVVRDEEIAMPILLGNHKRIQALMEEYGLDLEGVKIIDPKEESWQDKRYEYGDVLFEKRQRRGITQFEARQKMRDRNHFGAMMVNQGDADAFISGITRNYPETIRPALQIIGTEKGVSRIAGMYIVITKNGPVFFADTTINVEPTAQDLADIAVLTAKSVERMKIKPRIAMLSFANFGSSEFEQTKKVSDAVKILHEKHPKLVVDGELQANFALSKDLMKEKFPFSKLVNKKVNVLIFPNLSAGNIAYKLVQEMGELEAIGPVLLGLKKPVHILQLGSSVREIVNMATIAAVDAQTRK